MLSALCSHKLVDAASCQQVDVFKAAVTFARTEGIVPAPETAHAIKVVIDIARREKKAGCIVFNFSGHGLLDLSAYDKYLAGELVNYAYPQSSIKKSLKDLPKI